MPHKQKFTLQYDDDDDDYDDYYDDDDDDYDHDIKGEGGSGRKGEYGYDAGGGKLSKSDKTVSKSPYWQCSICTYDNHESLSECEMCGVLREPVIHSGTPTEENGMTSQPEKMVSKSLFWDCSSCTYNNVESSLRCEICGVLREPFKHSKPFKHSDSVTEEAGRLSQPVEKVSKSLFWQCSSCTYHNDGSLVNCEMCGVPRSPSINSPSILEEKASASTSASSSSNGKAGLKYLPYDGVSDGSSVSPSITSYGDETKSSASKDRYGDETKISASKDTLRRVNKDIPEMLASEVGNLKLESSSSIVGKSKLVAEYKQEKWMSFDQGQGVLNQLNLAIVGHVDSGKSTLAGRLLHLLGRISKKEMHKNEKEAKEKGKGSFAYAWAMDESVEERARGITMTVGVAYFDSKKYHVVLLDSPGHKDFIRNMISGTTQADAAILVVDASKGSFEAGMSGKGAGQTREHAQLIRSFGVEQIIVAINKMDVVEFSQERFEFIKLQLGTFLRSIGFKESSITWIPLSAIVNQNLVTAASDARLTSWYQGLCLLDAIDSLHPPVRDVSKPLCLPISDVSKSSSGQVAAYGKLDTGAIQNGSKVLVMPSKDLATVRYIERDSFACNIARAGDNVAVCLHGIDWANVISGGVLCHPDFPVAVATSLELKILVLDITTPILAGSQIVFHIHHAEEPARVVKILSLLDPKTGEVSKKNPRLLKSKQSAVIQVVLDRAVCVEVFSKCRALGRAFLRASGNTIAVGVVTRVIEESESANM